MARKRMDLKRPKTRIMLNIGALLDIPNSIIVTGAKGESIFMGSFSDVNAITGAGNSYKSVLLYYMNLAAANVIAATHSPYLIIYDTENNVSETRIRELSRRFEYLEGDIFDKDTGFIDYTDKSVTHGDAWWNDTKAFMRDVIKNEPMVEYTAFVDKEGKTKKDFLPTLTILDSISKFESKASLEMLDRAKKDDSSTNTYFMRAGLFKTKVLGEMSMLAPAANFYISMTAHIGKKSEMDENKYSKPVKTLNYLKEGEALKNVPKEFTYLTKILYKVSGMQNLKADDNNSPLYPMSGGSDNKTDLNLLRLEVIRSKYGNSGSTLPILVSQSEGVLPTLSEFHYIKTNGYFGLDGGNRSFNVTFLPKVSLSRTTIRTKINNSKKLRRAIQIASDLLQIKTFKPEIERVGLYMSPKDLYDTLISKGYDWEDILNTRSWFAIDQYNKDIDYFLSTLDLLKMASGEYTPYWLVKEKKNDKRKK